MSTMQTFELQFAENMLMQKSQVEAQVKWHNLKPTSAGIYNISALPMPQKYTVNYYCYYYYYYYYYYHHYLAGQWDVVSGLITGITRVTMWVIRPPDPCKCCCDYYYQYFSIITTTVGWSSAVALRNGVKDKVFY